MTVAMATNELVFMNTCTGHNFNFFYLYIPFLKENLKAYLPQKDKNLPQSYWKNVSKEMIFPKMYS